MAFSFEKLLVYQKAVDFADREIIDIVANQFARRLVRRHRRFGKMFGKKLRLLQRADVFAAEECMHVLAKIAQPQAAIAFRPRRHEFGEPQRLEAAWWDVGSDAQPALRKRNKPLATLRDYFLVRSEQAGLLWIYRERVTVGEQEAEAKNGPSGRQEDSHWYLHGLYG